ncbi:MAG: hypothetical protein H0S79_01835 [Anaerolineaceae bacterium]|jgi:hypothetical protein|nr:hypothetical protein [Anaerolineaceae bacterium]
MKKNTVLLVTLLLVMTLVSACSAAPAATEEVVDTAVLTVGEKAYTKADLEALGTMSADYTDKDGVTTTYEGVSLSALLDDAGLSGSTEITMTASDGYEASLTVEEAVACANCIVAFDGDMLRTVMPDMSGKLNVKDVIAISGN